ncbi:TPA: hypothetical protein N0F65_005181 [Lagenidium giganteum]|uniref:Phosphatidate cytidylyltransferase n=1 Tax=Lagenidium giganteum TaxID=4803 RepID=A0AAV2YYV5_9STRA|nr:TPA: hypothetical protein N0F65_005181 [Lagenidium giganteum]
MGRSGINWYKRIATVAIGVPTAILILSYDVGMLALATALCVGCLLEFTTTICPAVVVKQRSVFSLQSHAVLSVAIGIVGCLSAWWSSKAYYDATMLALTLTICVYHFVHTTKLEQMSLMACLLDYFSLIYIVSGFAHAILLRSATPFGFGFQLLGLSSAWVGDTGALLAGAFFGHVKLAPAISPGKTVVGGLAGVVSSVWTVVLLFALRQVPALGTWTQTFLPSSVSFVEQCVVGAILGVLCILGDLMESYTKRVAKVKDSGRFFPGHGGCLDRMDSFLFVAPFLYYYSSFYFSNVE